MILLHTVCCLLIDSSSSDALFFPLTTTSLISPCFASQVVRTKKILEVHIDKGMTDGQRITFSGEGDQEPGLEPGHIVIVLDESEHSTFK